MARAKNEYLNKQSLLREIHRSKMSWCYFPYSVTPYKKSKAYLQKYATFDYAVVMSKDGKPDKSILEDEAKLTIILNDKRRRIAKQNEVNKRNKLPTDDMVYTLDDLVIRINTYEHIPESTDLEPGKEYSKLSRLYHRVNFIPFKHYAKVDGKWEEVVISHYNRKGEFDPLCGQITDDLAKMYLLFAQKIAYLSKFRNYSYNEDFFAQGLVQLTKEGLRFDEAKVNVSKSKTLNPFAYLQQAIQNSFLKVLNEEAKVRNIRDDLLEDAGVLPSMTRQLKNEKNNESNVDTRQVVKKMDKDGNITGYYHPTTILDANKKVKQVYVLSQYPDRFEQPPNERSQKKT